MLDNNSTHIQPAGGFAAISKYNPHLWSAEQLRAIFVARTNELADLVQTLRMVQPDTVAQHVLLVGARGMGKSTLMRRLALAVEDDPSLSANWLPLRFPEEQYTVATLGQFWANVLDSFADTLQHLGESVIALDAAAERIAALPVTQQPEAYIDAINHFADERKQRLLLLVDNTDMLLHNIGKDAHWGLRATLQSNPRLFWIGGSYQSLEAESNYHDAFLDFFRVINLRPLKVEEMRQALLALAETFGGATARNAMVHQLDLQPERLPTLRQLSGGNPRTTVMLYEILANGQNGNVRSDLEALLDNMTPLYKARMDSLADLQRKLLAHILEHWAPISFGELAAVSQVAKGTISPQLQRLEIEGLIEKTSLHGTTRSGYQAAERFFNIWYLMRFSPRRQRNRLVWLVEFMRLWFSGDELCSLAKQRMSVGSNDLRSTHDLEYDRALADALPQFAPERHALRWSLLKLLQENNSQLVELFDFDGEDKEFKGATDYLRRLAALPSLLRQCPHAVTEQEKTHWVETVLGSISLTLEEKEIVAQKAEYLTLFQYDELLKVFSEEQKRWEKQFGVAALQTVRSAVLSQDFFSDMPDSHLAYEQVRVCFANNKEALRFVSLLFYSKHKDEWSYKAQKLALNLLHDDSKSDWFLREKLVRYEETEKAYCKAIEFNKEDAVTWNHVGNLLKDYLGRYEEAEAAYRQAIAIDKKFAYPWNNLGQLLHYNLNRYEESEAAYRQAIALDEKYAYPWFNLGQLLHYKLERYEESEAAYRQAIAIDENNAYPWNNLGQLLHEWLGRYEEAETAYRQAIALDEKYVYPVTNLARLLAQRNRKAEAETYYREAVLKDTQDTQQLFLQAHLFLGNRQLAMDALQALAEKAQNGNQYAFYRLKEQVWECYELGLGERLADWMAESNVAEFLTPFIQALYTLAGVNEKLRDLPMESQHMVDEIVRKARLRQEKREACNMRAKSIH
uniref:TPR repeat n=1 Tax=Chlorobium chlorochromatii (strain CaD3) TaxID=340177 RepID=Q3ATB6_CHLCH